MKNNQGEERGGGFKERGGGGLINFLPLKRGAGLFRQGGLFENGGLIEDLR